MRSGHETALGKAALRPAGTVNALRPCGAVALAGVAAGERPDGDFLLDDGDEFVAVRQARVAAGEAAFAGAGRFFALLEVVHCSPPSAERGCSLFLLLRGDKQ